MDLYAACHLYAQTHFNYEGDLIHLRETLTPLITDAGCFEVEPTYASLIIALDRCLTDQGVDAKTTKQKIDHVFSLLMPSVKAVNQTFWAHYQTHPKAATDFLHALIHASSYMDHQGIQGTHAYLGKRLIMTINQAKVEKDNKMVARHKTEALPCPLCFENIGFAGSETLPSRLTLRVATYHVCREPWFMQYSPYPYFNEHAIFIHQTHQPMVINPKTYQKLIATLDLFPHYFIGSNAALPIVGGSILGHEHYQGGKMMPMPLFEVESKYIINHPLSHLVSISVIPWMGHSVKLKSHDQDALIACAVQIHAAYMPYSDASIELIHATDAPHNSITPIVHKENDFYVAYILFRNNRTTEEFPEGLFHVHPSRHIFKKEAIGLIEAMGFFILPPRLTLPINHMMSALSTTQETLNQPYQDYQPFFDCLKESNMIETEKALIDGLEKVCEAVLEDIAVFKSTTQGYHAFVRFITSMAWEVADD